MKNYYILNMRLSIYITKKYNISRRSAKEYIKNGFISSGKSIITKDIEVSGSEEITLNISQQTISYNIQDFILYNDANYMFFYKPPFMHSERHKVSDNLTISDIYKEFPDFIPLSRLDYEADGVIGIISKNKLVNNISKSYYAIVNGDFNKNITLSNKIDADNKKKVKVLGSNNGFPTTIQKVEYNGKYSLLSVTLEKAARHQVRAFLSYLNYAILGDKLYGGENFKRLCLHCYSYTINDKTILCTKQTDNFIDLFHSLN